MDKSALHLSLIVVNSIKVSLGLLNEHYCCHAVSLGHFDSNEVHTLLTIETYDSFYFRLLYALENLLQLVKSVRILLFEAYALWTNVKSCDGVLLTDVETIWQVVVEFSL